MNRKVHKGLTVRESQVADLVREGLTDREISVRLFMSRRTAEWHLKQILNKLGFNSRAQVAAWVALGEGLASTADSPETHRHNLPLQLTTFVGRANEVAEIALLLKTKRLVTLTGVGGAGKTRLALEVAARMFDNYSDGGWLVDLTPTKDGHLIPRVFGAALGVREQPRQPMIQTLLEFLSGRNLLLVVDNCEHVIGDSADLLNDILRSCPGITVLATSRERLRLSGETVWRVPSLAVPGADARIDLRELAKYEAIGLFLDRAQLAAPGFEITAANASAVAQLCRRLDGIPLAIELAAARTGLISPDEILDRLEVRFELLVGGNRAGPERHRTLQSAIDWSHDLLSDQEQKLFRRLSVFAGTFNLQAIEQVCSGEDLALAAITGLLGSLVDKSLVIAVTEVSAPIRFRMLETLKQYGHERLTERGEVDQLKQRHYEFFVSIAEEASPKLIEGDQRAWHQPPTHDMDNLRLALESSSGRDPEVTLRLSTALTDFWYIHGLVHEGDSWLKGALAGYSVRNELRARALEHAGQFSYWRDDIVGASMHWNESLIIYRELADRRGIGRGLRWVGQVTEWQGDLETAHKYYDNCLVIAREDEDARSIAHIARHLGRLEMKQGNHAAARKHQLDSVSYFKRDGDQQRTTWGLGYLGLNEIESGNFEAARFHLEEGLTLARTLNFTIGASSLLMFFGTLAAAQSHAIRALHLAGASEALAESAGAAPIRLTKPIVERWLDRSRRKVGPGRSAVLREEGRAMSRQRAIEYALTRK
jgi:predicted ATPase/DNA-binding CsgD family transcriptional regulator